MGKGAFRVKSGSVKVEKVKTFGKDALALCGFLKFGDFGTLPIPPSSHYETYFEEVVVHEEKGKEKEESEEEKKARLEREEEEERERELREYEYMMREYEYEEMELDAVSAWEEHHHFMMHDSLWLEKECAKWDWKIFGKKWERKAHSRRERRPTRSLKKEKIDPKRYVRSRTVNTGGSKIAFQPRSIENYLPQPKKSNPIVAPPAPVSSSRPRRHYVPADYQPRIAPVARWEPIPASILNPVQPPMGNAVRQHQANRGNLDADLRRTLENSIVAAPSGKKYTPEQAARMLIEIQSREITENDFALLSILDECLQKKTVEKTQIEKLPVSLWKDVRGQGSSSESREETCRVCLLDYEDLDELITLPCHHLFHKGCIQEWLSNSSTSCPLDGLEVCIDA